MGAAVGTAVMMLGLAAPASAAPVISGISPDSGPVGCVVVITGTGFDQPGALAVANVEFTNGTAIGDEDAAFHVVSDTEIWTTVPALAADGPIQVTDGNAVEANSVVFDVDAASTDCAPTIASFTPTCGVVGTVVTITGTNLLESSGDDSATPATDPVGGEVRFNPYTGAAPLPPGATVTPTTLVVNVPTGALDGPIRVTATGTVDSTTNFDVVTDPKDCEPLPGVTHERTITLKLRKHLIAKGRITVADEFIECAASAPVKIQRKKPGGGWKTVKNTTTSSTGKYVKKIKDRPGKYRAKATKVTLASGDVCLKDVSSRVKHRH
jgi:hypothetical protein